MRKEIPQETVYLIIQSWFFLNNNKNEGKKTNKKQNHGRKTIGRSWQQSPLKNFQNEMEVRRRGKVAMPRELAGL